MKKVLLITSRRPAAGLSGLFQAYIDLGIKEMNEAEAYLSLFGLHDRKTYPGSAYIEALGAGFEPKENLCLSARLASLAPEGAIDRAVSLSRDDLELIAEMIDGMEIGGMRFCVKAQKEGLLIIAEGEGVSDEIAPNYSSGGRDAVSQVVALSESGKKTASALNKFIMKAYKNLNSANLGINPKPNIILIKSAEKRRDVPSSLLVKRRIACIPKTSAARGICRLFGIPEEKKDPLDLLSDYDIVWEEDGDPSLIKSVPGAFVQLVKEKVSGMTCPVKAFISANISAKRVYPKNTFLPSIIASREESR